MQTKQFLVLAMSAFFFLPVCSFAAEPQSNERSEWSLAPVSDEAKAEEEGAREEEVPELEGSKDARVGNDLSVTNGTKPAGYEDYLKELSTVVSRNGTTPAAMSPAAAKAYQQFLDDKKRQGEINRSRAEVTDDILKKAFSQGLSEESINSYMKLNQDPGEYSGKHLLVFVSSGMPEASIKSLLALLGNNDEVVFLIRGVVGNDVSKILPTQSWIKSLVCPGPEGSEKCYRAPVDINPVLFERLQITEVPALVYIPYPDTVLPACDGEASDLDFLTFYGDFSPLYALEKFLEKRPQDAILRRIYDDLTKKGFYQLRSGDSKASNKEASPNEGRKGK